MQRARATKARDPHDVLANEANLDRRESPDPRLGATFDDKMDDGIAGKREGVPAEVSSMRSFVTSSLPVCVSPWSDQMTGNVLRMDSTVGRKAPPAIRDMPRVDCGFLRTPPPGGD